MILNFKFVELIYVRLIGIRRIINLPARAVYAALPNTPQVERPRTLAGAKGQET